MQGRSRVLDVLRAHEPELKAAGVTGISVFGSAARDDANPSDVDIAVRLGSCFSRGGFHYFGRLEELEKELSRMLGCKVDVIEEPVRRECLRQEIERDRAVAF